MKIKNIIKFSIFSLLLLVLTSCSASNTSFKISNTYRSDSNLVTLKDYKNEVDLQEFMRLFPEITNNFYNGANDLVFEGKGSKVEELEEYLSSKNTRKNSYRTNLDFNLSFDKDSAVYNCNLKSNINRNNTTNSSADNASYQYVYDYTHLYEGNNFYSLNNAVNAGFRSPNILNLDANSVLVRKLLNDAEIITNNIGYPLNDTSVVKTRYYVDGNVFTLVSTFNNNSESYNKIVQHTINADNRELFIKQTLTKNIYDGNDKLLLGTKKEYNLQSKLFIKDLNLTTKNVNEYNVELVK